MSNKNLINAALKKRDEFYTQYSDIEQELSYYPSEQFRGKTIYCNCDDFEHSNFTQYFTDHFNCLGLKKLISTCYIKGGKGKIQIKTKDNTENGLLIGDGDFNSLECRELLNEADIIVTNPPFSLFRPFMDLVFERQKKFIVWCNQLSLFYKSIFPHYSNGEIKIGSLFGVKCIFEIPVDYNGDEKLRKKINNGRNYMINTVATLTNLEHTFKRPYYTSTTLFDSDKNKHYDNYPDMVECKSLEIPFDYNGKMGVPISFLKFFEPSFEQFEVLGQIRPIMDGKKKFRRVVIRWKNKSKTGKKNDKSNYLVKQY